MIGNNLPSTFSWIQLVLLNAVVCGVEFCAGTAFSYIPPLLLKAGLDEERMSWVLGIGPLLGFFLVPVIGRKSDHCSSSYGRRRPFILMLGATLLVSLVIIPYCDLIVTILFGNKSLSLALLIVGVVLLDFSGQACLTPCEALLSDACKNTDKHGSAFTIYSFMVSFGGCIGYFIAALEWKSTGIGKYFGSQEQCAFSMLIIMFILTLFTTLTVADERPMVKSSKSDIPGDVVESGSSAESEILIRSQSSICIACSPRMLWTTARNLHVIIFHYVLNVYDSIRSLPLVLRRLLLAHFFSWTAVMTFNVFFTDYVGQAVYLGSPNVPPDHSIRLLYDEGVRMGSWGLLLHCFTAAIYAYCVEWLVARFGIVRTYVFGMASFAVSMAALVMSNNVYVVNFFAACTGIAYATLTTLPYLLITIYHDDRHVSVFTLMYLYTC
jgi:solute carrier family 45 protein 3